MKIVLDIPESIIPASIKDLIKHERGADTYKREIVYAFLKLAIDEFHHCEIGVSESKLVLE